MPPRNIMRDSLHPIMKEMGRETAGFHAFRRFRESILQMSEARTLVIDCGRRICDGVGPPHRARHLPVCVSHPNWAYQQRPAPKM